MYIRCIKVLLRSPEFDPHKLWRHLCLFFSTYYAGQHSGCGCGDLLGNGTANPLTQRWPCSTVLKIMPVVYNLMYGHRGRFLFCTGISFPKCNGVKAHGRGPACSGKRVGSHVRCHSLNSFTERHRTRGKRRKTSRALITLCASRRQQE